MPAAMGALAHFGCHATTTADEEYDFTQFSCNMNEMLDDTGGIRGTRSHASERTRQGTRAPRFQITMQPNAVELDKWLPRILGAAEVADVFAVADTLITFRTTLDFSTARWYLTGCAVDKCVFEATQGGFLNMTLDVEALDFTTDGTAFPTITISTVTPYIFSDSASALAASPGALQFASWKLTIDNQLKKDRFFNAQTRASLPPQDRIVTWEWNGPYGDNSALFALAAAGVLSTATFTLGARSTLFSSAAVQYPREFPQLNSRDEIMLPLIGIARTSGATKEIVITNDSTP